MSDPIDWQAVSSTGPASPTGASQDVDTRTGGVALAPTRLGEALDMVRAISGNLDELREQARQAQEAGVTATSGGRHVTVVRSRNGSGLQITVDERWLESAHEVAIGRELLEALQGAHDAALRPPADAEDGAITRLRELTASPDSLLQWAGLPVPSA